MYQKVAPPPSLAKYIEHFWYSETDVSKDNPFIYLSTASSRAELLFHYEGTFNKLVSDGLEKNFTAGIYGQTGKFEKYYSGIGRIGMLGVTLYPQALPALFAIPANLITNGSADVISMLGNEGEELVKRVMDCENNNDRIKLLCHFFEGRLMKLKNKYLAIEWAIDKIHQGRGQVNLKELVEGSFLSERQFERNFKEIAGFSAKSYLKIVRFESVVNNFIQFKTPFTTLALDHGYFDQAHLNRDFREFTGMTPTGYFESISEFVL